MGESLIRKIYLAGSYDLKAVEEFLEEQAQNGLMFVKQKGIFYYFEKCEPKKVHFAVDVFEKASIYDTRPEAKAQEYIEYCEECGWKFLFSNGKIQFFYSEEENPVDIQTDDELKLKIIHKNVLFTRGASWLCVVFLFLMQVTSGVFREFMGADMVEQFILFGPNLILIVTYVGVMVCISVEVIRYIRFYVKNKKRIKNGQKLQYIEKKKVEKYHKVVCTLYVSFLVLLFLTFSTLGSMGYISMGAMLVCVLILYLMEFFRQGNKKMSRQDNIIIVIVSSIVGSGICIAGITLGVFVDFFDFDSQKVKYYDEEEKCYVYTVIESDEIPLTMEDLGIVTEGVEYNQTSAYDYTSIFGELHQYAQMYFDKDVQDIGPMLSYDIVKSSWDKILDSYVDDYLEKSYYECTDITEEEGELWGAKQVYSLRNVEEETEERLVVYDEQVIYFSCDRMEYSEDTISIIKKGLNEETK